MNRIRSRRPGRRLAAASLAVASAAALAAVSGGAAVASVAAPRVAWPERPPPRPGLSLAQAPPGLQAAVARTLGASAARGGWSQRAELAASNGEEFDRFGDSVAISGRTAVVGAHNKNDRRGAVYVFVRSGHVWSQQAELTASDAAPDDNFGFAVAISGKTVVVSADGKNSNTGAAYVFARRGQAWSQQAELTASDGAEEDLFGASVAISGKTALIGAYRKDSGTGAAYVFARSGRTWSQQAELTASDAAPFNRFGFAVAISGQTALIGAPLRHLATGAAYVFVRTGRTWSQQAELTASDAAPGRGFGHSVAISGQTALVGATGNNQGAGAMYVFVRTGRAWSQRAELTASDAAPGDEFGVKVAISGRTAVIGAVGKDDFTGAAYVFVRTGRAWSQRAELTASDAAPDDDFGFAVGISGKTALVGAGGKNSATGRRTCSCAPEGLSHSSRR